MPTTERFTDNAESVGLSTGRLNRINTTMQRYIDEGKFAGMVTLVARRGQIAHFQTHGRADIESGRSMARDTVCRIYSMTKPVTAVAAMMLYEEGRFWIDPQEQLIGILMTQFMPNLTYPVAEDFRILVYQAIDD